MTNRVRPEAYYSREWVREEIAGFLRGRWAAYTRGDLWVRWVEGDRPLKISSPGEVWEAVSKGGARSFYGTIEVFKRLEDRADIEWGYLENVVGADGFIDIDIVREDQVGAAWEYAIRAAKVLVEWFKLHGVREGLYILWSGAGVHVRLHRASIDPFKAGLDPVQAMYVLMEYALRENLDRLRAIAEASQGLVKVENVIGRKRLFTAPLSLHRILDMAAIPLDVEDLRGFTPKWADPENPRYTPGVWDRYSRGEAQEILVDALNKLGPSPERTVISAGMTARRIERMRRASPRIGRFPVMALLQAARYYILNGDLEKAKSFGLNRAIFYAWAKYYGPARSAAARLRRPPPKWGGRRVESSSVELKRVPGMNEEAPMSRDGWFVMGGVEQRPEDYDRNVARRFEEAGIPYDLAWRAALEYVSRFPRSILRDPQKFYQHVYEPVRDQFVERVLGLSKPTRIAFKQPPGVNRMGQKERRIEKKQRTLLEWFREDGE
ncbi:MAG: hypothetical protein F7C35_03430 [Desulfurococcales archaeon]|nr:hypothetical protein [Desulfurococcales archaeon]